MPGSQKAANNAALSFYLGLLSRDGVRFIYSVEV